MNKVLARQLRRLNLSPEKPPESAEDWKALLDAIGAAYDQSAEDRYLLERSLEISSREMSERLAKNKELSLQLMQASKLASIGTLASGIAHELNNPLQAIAGYIELLMTKDYDQAARIKNLERISRLSARMAGTIRNLLRLSRKNEDQRMGNLSVLDPIRKARDLLGQQLIYDQISLEVVVNSQSPMIRGELNQLFGVFQNLISNSRDAFRSMKERSQSKILIAVDELPDDIKVSSKDNAGEIPESIVGRIFDPFFTTKEVGSGTGLGLALARQTVEDMNGTMTVNVLGPETTFTLIFPKAVNENSSENTGAIGSVGKIVYPQTPTRQLSILIVDDEEDICDQLEAQFESTMKVKKAKNGLEAIKLLSEEKFDVLLTDVKMPGASGFVVAQAARKTNPKIFLVMISGHIDGQLPDETSALEPFLIIEKPFKSLAALFQSVNKFVYSDSITGEAPGARVPRIVD
jgi:signal transduction histidine kinase